ncbi:MAG: CRTAC1 family protein [Acidobacteriota bacterium]
MHFQPPRLCSTHRLLALALAATLAAAPGFGDDIFVDRSTASGLGFTHWNGRTGALYFPEMTGQGAALFDADGDGDLDVYFVQGTWLRPEDRGKTLEEPPSEAPRDLFFRNDGARGGMPRFTDATEASGLKATGYGMGVATGDVDGDGHPDLYVANYGKDQLWRSRGDGTFEDWTERAGIAGDASTGGKGWSIGGSFADVDRDGDLDLFVLDYVRFDVIKNPRCYATSSRRDYCGPSSFKSAVNRFYRNRGDGTFEDATAAAGINSHAGASLGVVAADFDADGWLDFYVANDGEENNLWRNTGKGTFSDEALLAGVAFNREGQPEASMGIATGDVDNDGDLDLFLTHLMGETNTLYADQGGALFDDRSIESGLAAPSLGLTSFGTAFVDVDNDSWLDLVVISGAVRQLEDLAQAGDDYPLDQPDQLFLNRGGRFTDATARVGGGFQDPAVGRGLATGDVDNDGDIDLLVTNNNGPARLLINVGPQGQWAGLDLRTRRGASKALSPALAATVEVVKKSGDRLLRRAASDGSYASASDPRVLLGLGDKAPAIDHLLVRWPDGHTEKFPPPVAGRYSTLVRGDGVAPQKAGKSPQGDSK